jgi:hypothetical protein
MKDIQWAVFIMNSGHESLKDWSPSLHVVKLGSSDREAAIIVDPAAWSNPRSHCFFPEFLPIHSIAITRIKPKRIQ